MSRLLGLFVLAAAVSSRRIRYASSEHLVADGANSTQEGEGQLAELTKKSQALAKEFYKWQVKAVKDIYATEKKRPSKELLKALAQQYMWFYYGGPLLITHMFHLKHSEIPGPLELKEKLELGSLKAEDVLQMATDGSFTKEAAETTRERLRGLVPKNNRLLKFLQSGDDSKDAMGYFLLTACFLRSMGTVYALYSGDRLQTYLLVATEAFLGAPGLVPSIVGDEVRLPGSDVTMRSNDVALHAVILLAMSACSWYMFFILHVAMAPFISDDSLAYTKQALTTLYLAAKNQAVQFLENAEIDTARKEQAARLAGKFEKLLGLDGVGKTEEASNRSTPFIEEVTED